MPKTILLPESLVTDKTLWPKVIVLQECESRDSKGNLLFGQYKFVFNNLTYWLVCHYKHNKCINSQLYHV